MNFPPISGDLHAWARVVQQRIAAGLPKLMHKGANASAADDGLIMWDPVAEEVVVSKAGSYVSVGGAGGATDLAYTASTRVLTSSTGTDVTLPLVTSGDAGLAPASGGGTTNYLRADGTWATPPDTDTIGAEVPLYGVLGADYTLTSTTAAQKLFNLGSGSGGALTIPSTGRYRFHLMLYITGMSATTGNAAINILGTGTATLGTILYHIVGIDNSAPFTAGTRTGSGANTAASAAAILSAGTGTALIAEVSGMMDVTATGTLLPTISLLTASAAVVKTGSFMVVQRMGSGATAGTWT